MSKKKLISDRKIADNLGVPPTTLQDWKNKEFSNWRYKVYNFIKSKSQQELEDFVKDLELRSN